MVVSNWKSIRGTPWLVVSYFTDEFYAREAWELVRSCDQFGPDYIVERVDVKGWEAATNYKPSFILQKVQEYKDRAIMWLDADARFRRRPWMLESTRCVAGSVAYRTINNRPASGTILLPVVSERVPLLERWVNEVRKDPKATDQICLDRVISGLTLKHVDLPPDYCWIYDFDEQDKKKPDPNPADTLPVIEHMQASRWRRV